MGRIITKDNPNPTPPGKTVQMPQKICWEHIVGVLVSKINKEQEILLAPKDFEPFMTKELLLMQAVSNEGISLKVMTKAQAQLMMQQHQGSEQ